MYFNQVKKVNKLQFLQEDQSSNHTLVLLNGVAINDQSVTDGLHDFGQDFINTLQQVDIYKGSSGVHFGPNAIAGAINFITDEEGYDNSYTIGGSNEDNLNLNYNKRKNY